MKALLLIPLAILLMQNRSIAQDPKIDSLETILRSAKDDTGKVNTLYELSEVCAEEDILNYAIPAFELAKKLNFKKGIADACNNIGYVYNNKGDIARALEYHTKSWKIREEIGDKKGIAASLNNIAVIYNNKGDIMKALEFHLRSLRTQEALGNKIGIATSLNNIGFIYKNQGSIPDALDYYQKSLNIYEEIDDKQGVATSYNNISSLYESQGDAEQALEYDQKSLKTSQEISDKYGIARSLGNIGLYYNKKGDSARALSYHKQSLAIFEEIGNKTSASISLKNIGYLYKRMGNLHRAIEYYNKSLKIQEEIGDKRLTAAVLNDLGDIYLAQRNYNKSIDYCSRSLAMARSIGNPEGIQGASGNLSQIYAATGRYKDAYLMQVLFKQMSDSVSNTETRKSVVKKQMQYEYAKKEAVLKAEQKNKDALAYAEIKRQKLIKNSTLGGVSMAGIFSFFLVWSFNRRRKTALDKQVAEVEMKAMRLQMNPHFIFNCLHSINKYVIDNDKDNASVYLSRFAKLMRLILENSREQEVPLEKDLSALELYMQLESLRFQNKFRYMINVDPEIDMENTLIPPMLLQPFVENSIIHGVQSKELGLIKINITREGEMIRCIVEDNGVGRKQSVKIRSGEEKKRESLGMKITQDRLYIINQLKKVKTAINIFDLKDAGGLRVELMLPFEQSF